MDEQLIKDITEKYGEPSIGYNGLGFPMNLPTYTVVLDQYTISFSQCDYNSNEDLREKDLVHLYIRKERQYHTIHISRLMLKDSDFILNEIENRVNH